MPAFNCQKTDEVKNPKRGGRLLGDGQPVRLAMLCEVGYWGCFGRPRNQACERKNGENHFIFGRGQTLEGQKPRRAPAAWQE